MDIYTLNTHDFATGCVWGFFFPSFFLKLFPDSAKVLIANFTNKPLLVPPPFKPVAAQIVSVVYTLLQLCVCE